MDLKGKDFINLKDYTKEELLYLLDFAQEIKQNLKNGKKLGMLNNKTLVMYFEKPSLRTRLSFEIGMQKLGGQAVVVKKEEINLGKRESIEDTARVIERYANGVMIRTFDHGDVEDFAKYSSIPVINALTDLSHPCQIMADMLTIREYFKTFKGLKLAYIGDGNNIAHSLITGCAILGIDIAVATPNGYVPNKKITQEALEFARGNSSKVHLTQDPEEAVQGANILCTDTWTSMGQEKEAEERRKIFKNYQINADLLKSADKDHIVLHCLPAHKGEEITSEVFEKYSKNIFDEAENRMHAQMAIMASIM